MMLQKEIIAMKEFNQSNQAGLEALKEVEKLKESLLSDDKNHLPPDVKLGQVRLEFTFTFYTDFKMIN